MGGWQQLWVDLQKSRENGQIILYIKEWIETQHIDVNY